MPRPKVRIRRRPFAALIAGLTVVASVGIAVPSAAAVLGGRAKVDPGLLREALARPAATLHVIVRESRPASNAAERLVGDLGGKVSLELPLVDGFSASLPASGLAALARSDSVVRIWGDARIRSENVSMGNYDKWPPNVVWRATVHLPEARLAGIPPLTGVGVTVAVLDTGISNLADFGNRVLARVDLTPEHDGYDRYGHGT
ncbi:MAG: hypothetical protein ACHQNA_12540, partial [Acidimicrobiales bacterium]